MLNWLYKIVIPEHKLVRALPIMCNPKEPLTDEQLDGLSDIIRKVQAKRKIKRALSFGVFPIKFSQGKKLHEKGVPRWVVKLIT